MEKNVLFKIDSCYSNGTVRQRASHKLLMKTVRSKPLYRTGKSSLSCSLHHILKKFIYKYVKHVCIGWIYTGKAMVKMAKLAMFILQNINL